MDEKLANFLREVRRAAPDQKVNLVGGAVRDLVLGRAVKDLDFVVADGSVQLAKTVRRRFEGVWYTLDDDHQTARVILRQGQPGELILDFTAFIAGSLEEDLRQRDFTINAMAIDLDNLDVVIDPLGGQNDLRDGCLRLGNPRSLLSDPLRVLRAVRMVRAFSLNTSLEIIEQLRVATLGLNKISGERIRDELLKCLAVPDLGLTYDLLKQYGVLYQLLNRIDNLNSSEKIRANDVRGNLPGIDDNSEIIAIPDGSNINEESDPFHKRLLALEKMLLSIEEKDSGSQFLGHALPFLSSPEILHGLSQLLGESLQGGRTRKQLLILFTLFFYHHPAFSAGHNEKVELDCLEFAGKLTNAFMLGQKEQKFFELVCVGYQKMISLNRETEVGALQLYRYYKEVGSFALESAVLHLVNQSAAISPNQKIGSLAEKIIHTWFFDYETIVNPVRLVDGDDLQKTLHIEPGPNMGFYLESVRETQVMGEVQSRDEALALVLRMMKEG